MFKIKEDYFVGNFTESVKSSQVKTKDYRDESVNFTEVDDEEKQELMARSLSTDVKNQLMGSSSGARTDGPVSTPEELKQKESVNRSDVIFQHSSGMGQNPARQTKASDVSPISLVKSEASVTTAKPENRQSGEDVDFFNNRDRTNVFLETSKE